MGCEANAASLECLCAAELAVPPCSVWVSPGSGAVIVRVAASHVTAAAILVADICSADCDVLLSAASVVLSARTASSGLAALLAWSGAGMAVSAVMSACNQTRTASHWHPQVHV